MTDRNVEKACEAHTNVCIFEAVIRMLEGGLHGPQALRDAEAIARLCRDASARQLRLYGDAAKAARHG